MKKRTTGSTPASDRRQLELPWDTARALYVSCRRILVCGTRNRHPETSIRHEIACFPAGCVVITGAAPGVDRLAGDVAAELGLRVETYEADWALYGPAAGPIRNRVMLDSGVDLVLAFWDGVSAGTEDCIRQARKRGIAVRVVDIP